MKVIVSGNTEIASQQTVGFLSDALKEKPHSVFLLPTGGTPLEAYAILRDKYAAGKIDFSHATSFNLDEYLGLKKGHPESYRSFMHKNLFGHVNFKKGNVYIPDGNTADPDRYCAEYDAALRGAGVDLALLGIGTNGHIGFNEPGTKFDSITHVAKLNGATIKANARFFRSAAEVPRRAVTCGLGNIMAAKKIVLMAFGKQKAAAVAKAIEGPVTEAVPASVLQRHPDVTFVLDREASMLLKSTPLLPPLLGGIRLYSDFNLPRGKKIVYFSPHPDDAAICSGAILKKLAETNEVREVVMTSGHRAVVGSLDQDGRIALRERETEAEAKILGSLPYFLRLRFYESGELDENDMKKLRELMQRVRPDIAFVPQRSDAHPTHKLSRKIALACLPQGIEVWSFETPWALFGHGKFNAAFEFGEKTMRTKLGAIRKHRSQTRRTSFDLAAHAIAHFRRITIAEQFFSELGKKPIKTDPYLELYDIKRW